MNKFMRMLVFFDIPVKTKRERRIATAFRNFLLKDGYHMVQYSVYARVCNGMDAVQKHRSRLNTALPENGSVRLLVITEKQYETIEINLPIERQLTFTPSKETEYKDKPQEAVLGIDDLERIGKLYNPYYVDRKILRSRIDEMLKDKGQTTIAEVIANNSGIEKGLSELFGYIGILKEYKTVVSTEHTQYITFSEDKSIEIPEIIITR